MRQRLTLSFCMAALGCLALATSASADGGCCDSCPPGYKKECVPVPSKKTVTHRVYSDRCEDFCLPKCSLFGHHGGNCGGCDGCSTCGNCEKVRTRKVLIVRLRSCEECENKCEVQLVPSCDHAPSCCGGTVILQGQPAMSAPRTEQAPMPGVKK